MFYCQVASAWNLHAMAYNMHAYIHAYIHACMHARTYVCTYIHTYIHTYSPRHKHWPGALFRLPGQFGPVHFIFHWPPRYMPGHHISNSGGDDKSQYVLFARVQVPPLGSFPAVLLLQRDASVTRVGVRHVNQTHWRQMRTSGTHPGIFLREAHGMVSSKQFCVLVG